MVFGSTAMPLMLFWAMTWLAKVVNFRARGDLHRLALQMRWVHRRCDRHELGWSQPPRRVRVSQTPDPAELSPAARGTSFKVCRLHWLKSSEWHFLWPAPAHLSVVKLKVSQLETLLQFGLMSHPELIKSSFCFVQLRQQPGIKNNNKETT